jgi:TonB-linked SusC/RagA family outer membrane protein
MKKLLCMVMLLMTGLLQQVYAQDRTISGRVTDRASGQGLPGATVLVKGTAVGASTNADGGFSLSVPASATTLTISSIGYSSVDQAIGADATYNVALATDVKQLNEVVVTAVGIERQEKALPYSVDVVSSRSLTQGRETNPIAALQGKIAGANIAGSSGGVNSSKRITLRGTRSFQGENQPLFVVDGIIINNSSIQSGSGANGGQSVTSVNQVDVGNRVGDINPDDIETITVLKGPSAAALYGSAASNGAIIITTKSGKDAARLGKKAQINYTSSFVASSVLKLPDFQNDFGSGFAGQFLSDENTNWGPKFGSTPTKDNNLDQGHGNLVQYGATLPGIAPNLLPYEAHPNNVKDFFNTGTNLQNTLSLQGGNETTNYYLSVSDAVQKGIIPDDRFRRNTIKLTAGTKLLKNLTATTSVNYNHNNTDIAFEGSGIGGVLNNVYNVSRGLGITDYKDVNGPYGSLNGFFSGYYDNPYRSIQDNRFLSKLDRVIGNVSLNYAPVDWFSLTYRIGSDVSFDRRSEHTAIRKYLHTLNGKAFTRPTDNPGTLNEVTIFQQNLTTDLLATFKHSITPDISAQLIVGENLRSNVIEQNNAMANALVLPDFYNLSNRSGNLTGGTFVERRRLLGTYGDLTLSFRDYLFLNATARNDWSSTLPKDSRSYFYPSVGLTFVYSDAIPVLKDNSILTYGKIRGSYAIVGNDAPPYSLLNTFPSATGFPFGSRTAFTVSNVANNNILKPERTQSTEIGTEFGLLKDRIGGEVTVYQTITTNLISQLSVPYSTGFTAAVLNVGKIENRGLESSIRATPIRLDNGFRWDFGVNFAYQNSEVKELYPNVSELAQGTGNPVSTAIVGQPFPVLKGTAFLRDPEGRVVVRQATDPDSKLVGFDPQADPVQRVLGQVAPKYIWGGNMAFSFKGLRAAFVVDAKKGASIYSGTKNTLSFTGSSTNTTEYNRERFVYPNSVVEVKDASGKVTSYAPNTNLTSDGGFNFFYNKLINPIAEYSVISADYLKLREVSITYELPESLLKSTFLGRASIGVSGRNLLLFVPKENKFIDPEANVFGTGNSQGREFNTTPTTRDYGVNLSVTF